MAQEVFARYEKKYWLSPDQYHVLRGLLLDRMREDDYGRYTICNIYYDTPDYHLIRTSLEKPIYKEKLRLRSYGVPNAQSQVFLELKKKYRGVVYKRRAALAPDEAQAILSGAKRADGTQILREIAWALQFYRPSQRFIWLMTASRFMPPASRGCGPRLTRTCVGAAGRLNWKKAIGARRCAAMGTC